MCILGLRVSGKVHTLYTKLLGRLVDAAAAPRQLEPRFTDLQTASGLKIAFRPRQLTRAYHIATNLFHLCFAGKGNIRRLGDFTYEPGAQPLSAFARAQEKLSEHTKAKRIYLAITVGVIQSYSKCTLK
jgi:hypothetical protein